MRSRLTARRASGLLLALFLAGCGTTKMTDSPRAATEMLLVSQAVDNAVAKIDFTPLSGQPVFLDTTSLDKDVVDKGYLISVVRQQLLAHGALLQEERFRAVLQRVRQQLERRPRVAASTLGAPLMTPLEGSRARPDGRLPELTE